MSTNDSHVYGQLFIDGTWRDSASGGRGEVLDPSTGRVIGSVADADRTDVDDALAAARAAFIGAEWAGRGPTRAGRRAQRTAADRQADHPVPVRRYRPGRGGYDLGQGDQTVLIF
ncbi:aldehyde dehydrogenase family protein [Nocardia sp. NPDC052112]|uniref:aldehyde dehydrogenase family protein n=1 Tax=Nocardia sp. NPDC052112 TaxID=3155646 RepID=UPI0034389FBA